jgi:hypothetical protein
MHLFKNFAMLISPKDETITLLCVGLELASLFAHVMNE